MHVLCIKLCSCIDSCSVNILYNFTCSGNYMGRKPFTKGDVCTKCGSDKGWCDSGLCCEGERLLLNIAIIVLVCLPPTNLRG